MPRKEMPKKWCFLVTSAPYLSEFFGKLACEIIKKGDECILIVSSKITEYTKLKYFPKNVKILSKVDWCLKNYKKNQKEFYSALSWKDFFSEFDRYRSNFFKFNYNDSLEIMSQWCQFADFALGKEKPDVVIYEPPSGISSKIIRYFCQKYKIPYLGLMGSRFDDKIDVYDLEYTLTKYEKTFKKLNNDNISEKEKKFSEDFISDFLSHKKVPNYMYYWNIYGSVIAYLKQSVKRWSPWLKYILKRSQLKSLDFEDEIYLKYRLWYPLKSLTLRLKRLFQRNIYGSLSDNDDFFLFPLQVQPEASTSVSAPFFSDLLNTVKNIAFSLPLPWKLYVKEHPSAKGDRPWDFYQILKRIPNVVLISPSENVESLIKKSQGVITLTSTIGMEAALAGKPVYVLGDVSYIYHPSCKKINSFEGLKQRIREDLRTKPAISNLRDINLRFIISYFRNTISGDIYIAGSRADTNDYGALYDNIKNII